MARGSSTKKRGRKRPEIHVTVASTSGGTVPVASTVLAASRQEGSITCDHTKDIDCRGKTRTRIVVAAASTALTVTRAVHNVRLLTIGASKGSSGAVFTPRMAGATEATIHIFTSGAGGIHSVPAIGNSISSKVFRVSMVTENVEAKLGSEEGEATLIAVTVASLTAIISTTVVGAPGSVSTVLASEYLVSKFVPDNTSFVSPGGSGAAHTSKNRKSVAVFTAPTSVSPSVAFSSVGLAGASALAGASTVSGVVCTSHKKGRARLTSGRTPVGTGSVSSSPSPASAACVSCPCLVVELIAEIVFTLSDREKTAVDTVDTAWRKIALHYDYVSEDLVEPDKPC